jgi:hypothetical protein
MSVPEDELDEKRLKKAVTKTSFSNEFIYFLPGLVCPPLSLPHPGLSSLQAAAALPSVSPSPNVPVSLSPSSAPFSPSKTLPSHPVSFLFPDEPTSGNDTGLNVTCWGRWDRKAHVVSSTSCDGSLDPLDPVWIGWPLTIMRERRAGSGCGASWNWR